MAKVEKFYADARAQIDANADKLVELGALSEKDKIDGYIKRVYAKQLEEAKGAFSAVFGGDTSHARGIEKTVTIKDVNTADFHVDDMLNKS